MTSFPEVRAETVLVLAPTLNDTSVAVEVLEAAGFPSLACRDLNDLSANIAASCGAVVLSEEAIGLDDIAHFQNFIKQQPAWSDIPIILLTSNDAFRAIDFFSESGNISILERPFSKLTLVRSVEVALRARRRQYEVRDLLTELNRAKIEAERANLSKTQFLANMSHEIRTPIGSILGFTNLMKSGSTTPQENVKYMGIVERNSKQLLRLIDDILDLSKVEAGKMTIEKINFSLTEFLSEFNSTIAFRAAESEIRYVFEAKTLIPNQICTDPVRLRQILTNIVGNALKFTNYGEVKLSASFENSTLKFDVQDSGVGIAPEQAAKLFQPFSQADASTTRKFGGTGLGLALSRRLAESLGGKLELEASRLGEGSVFAIEIQAPLLKTAKLIDPSRRSAASGPQRLDQREKLLPGLKVLLVEDSADNQMLVTAFLKREGAEVTSVFDGAQGVELAMKQSFDVLLMDIQMPILDGHEATRKLRSSNYTKPIIALTAHAMKEEHSRCVESGFTAFLTKPIERTLLIEKLSSFVRH